MKNKRGFVLVETIFVIAVLASSLVLIYSAFSNVVSNQKSRLYYDHTTYLYRTYYILNFLNDQGLKTYADDKLSTSGSKPVLSYQLHCSPDGDNPLFVNGSLEMQACENIFVNIEDEALTECVEEGSHIEYCERLGINTYNGKPTVYIMHYNVDSLLECYQEGIDNCNADKNSFEDINERIFPYLKTLNGQTSDENDYRIVIEYKTLIKEGEDEDGTPIYNTYYYYSSLGF